MMKTIINRSKTVMVVSMLLSATVSFADGDWGLVDALSPNSSAGWPFHDDTGLLTHNASASSLRYNANGSTTVTRSDGDWAPNAVYRCERYINGMTSSQWMLVQFSNLVPGANYRVCYLGAEVYHGEANKRVFGIEINGSSVESALDLYDVAGGKNVALTKYYDVQATQDGTIAVKFTKGTKDNAKYGGLAVFSTVPPQDLVLNAASSAGTTENTIAYSAKNALSYVLQRADSESGPWADIVPESLSRCGEMREYVDTVPSVDSCVWYRLVASNGVCSVTSDVKKVDKSYKTQVVYAFNCGGDEATYGRFAPADWMDASIVPYARALGTIGGVDLLPNMAPQGVFSSVYRSQRLSFTLPNLKTDKSYQLRLYSADDASAAAGDRVMRVLVNDDEVVSSWDVFDSVGVSTACELDVDELSPDANGRLKLEIVGTTGLAQLCAFELVETYSDEIPLVPVVKGVYPVANGAAVVIGQSSASVTYSVRRKRAGSSVYETIAESARLGWYDREAEAGSAYSVRARGLSGSYSDWSSDVVVSASADSPLKWIGMGRDGTSVVGKYGTYRNYVRPTGDNKALRAINCGSFSTPLDFSTQIDPIPDYMKGEIYYTTNDAGFGGFNAVLTNLVPNALYRVRMTTSDNYSSVSGARILDLYVNANKIVSDLDICRTFKQSRVASCETLVRATPNGIIFTEVRSTVENPQINAVEAWLTEGGDAVGVESSSTADSISYGGFICAPDTDEYSFEVGGTAKLTLFVDDKPVVRRSAVSDATASGSVVLSQGFHRYRLFVAEANAGAPSVTWSSSSLAAQSVAPFLSHESANTQSIGLGLSIREFETLGLGGDAYRLGTGGSGSDVWRLVGSGSDLYSTKECILGVVASMRHGGEVTMRVLNIHDCAKNAKVGVFAQDATPPFNAASYFLAADVTRVESSGSFDNKTQLLIANKDAETGKVKSITADSSSAYSLPIWLKLVDTIGEGASVTVSYSRDGTTWTQLSSTPGRAGSSEDKVDGMFITGCSDAKCAIAEVDNVTVKRYSPPGMSIIFR